MMGKFQFLLFGLYIVIRYVFVSWVNFAFDIGCYLFFQCFFPRYFYGRLCRLCCFYTICCIYIQGYCRKVFLRRRIYNVFWNFHCNTSRFCNMFYFVTLAVLRFAFCPYKMVIWDFHQYQLESIYFVFRFVLLCKQTYVWFMIWE